MQMPDRARDVRIIRVRKNRATNFFAPAVFAQPRRADEWMSVSRALLLIRVSFVIHVVQQSSRLPYIRVRAAKLREMFHRVRDRVAMFSQTLRLHPLVQNGEGAFGIAHIQQYIAQKTWTTTMETN